MRSRFLWRSDGSGKSTHFVKVSYREPINVSTSETKNISVSETVLIAWICGEEAKFMETLKMNVVADTCTMILKKFLADPFIPKPKSCLL